MLKQTERRSGIDLRMGHDRRRSQQLNPSGTSFVENRKGNADGRRVPGERREGYTLISKWHGALLGVELEPTENETSL